MDEKKVTAAVSNEDKKPEIPEKPEDKKTEIPVAIEPKSEGKPDKGKVEFGSVDELYQHLQSLKIVAENDKNQSAAIKQTSLKSLDLDGCANFLLQCKNVVFMTGAGISTSAGIPDFRSPNTGLYSKLAKYNLPFPEAVFSIEYFKINPQAFYTLSKELIPENYKPTISHYFQRLCVEKGLVHKIYTQNIDALENVAQIPANKIINAHGSFNKGHCLLCKDEYSLDWMKKKIKDDEFLRCESPKCVETAKEHDLNIVKPDVTFFGEEMPAEFVANYGADLAKCDFLIVMGTSLKVQPFSSLTHLVSDDCPRLLINLEAVGGPRWRYNQPEFNRRDVFLESDCDNGCLQLAELLGWKKELEELVKTDHLRIDKLK